MSEHQQQSVKKKIEKRWKSLENERSSWLSHWREIADYMLPRRGRFMVGPNQSNKGDRRNQKILDPIATKAIRIGTSGLSSSMTSPARNWFKLGLGNTPSASSAVKVWLEESDRRMRRVMAASNFYNSMGMVYQELLTFGTAVIMIDEDYDDVIRCYTMTAGEYCLALDGRLAPSTVIRKIVMTVEQLKDRFGEEALSPQTMALCKNGEYDKEIEVIHAIFPNHEQDPGALGGAGGKWRGVYFECGGNEDKLLEDIGYDVQPFMAPRWEVASNDPYGSSPGMDALPEVKALQLMQRRKAQGIDKMVNPPLKASPGMKNEPISAISGGVSYTPDPRGEGLAPIYMVNPQLGEMRQDIQEVHNRINSIFYVDIFMMISQLDDVRSATEINERREEKKLQLGPALERLQDELLDPAIERVFAIMVQAGLIPPPPEEIQGAPIDIEYISDLAQAQRSVGTNAIERTLAWVGNLAGVRPDVLDKINFDETVDQYSDMMGVSPKIVIPTEQANETRQARAEAAAQQQQAAQALQAVEGAKLLSETQIGGGENALQRMVGL